MSEIKNFEIFFKTYVHAVHNNLAKILIYQFVAGLQPKMHLGKTLSEMREHLHRKVHFMAI